MKVRELLKELEKYDPDTEIEIPIQTFTQAYPSGYFGISWVKPAPQYSKRTVRFWVHLGEGYIISKRGKK